MSSKNPEKDIYEAALMGTKNIMEAAHATGVEKIIYTSSVGVLGESKTNNGCSTEADYIENPKLHYIRAKTDSEKLSWEYAEKYNMDMITALPSGMIGPGFLRSTPTTDIFVKLFRNEVPIIPQFHLDYVDVRDVAKGHVDLFEKNEAKGRYILSGQGFHTRELAQILRDEYPDMKIPKIMLPDWMMPLAVFFDLVESSVKGTERLLTSDVVYEFGNGKMQKFSSQKARQEINWNPRPISESLRDTIEWIKQNFQKKNR
jgi:dihydroflavonol-4-reductase